VRGRFGRKEPYPSVRSLEGRLTYKEYFGFASSELDFTKHAVCCVPLNSTPLFRTKSTVDREFFFDLRAL
jgi:hypothetical protein